MTATDPNPARARLRPGAGGTARELDAWVAYYRHDWLRLLVASVGSGPGRLRHGLVAHGRGGLARVPGEPAVGALPGQRPGGGPALDDAFLRAGRRDRGRVHRRRARGTTRGQLVAPPPSAAAPPARRRLAAGDGPRRPLRLRVRRAARTPCWRRRGGGSGRWTCRTGGWRTDVAGTTPLLWQERRALVRSYTALRNVVQEAGVGCPRGRARRRAGRPPLTAPTGRGARRR